MADEPVSSGSMPDSLRQDFFVVGIGASAGGIQALRQFFSHVAPNGGMAFVVILHLSPQYESNLPALIQNQTSLAVTQVREAVKVEPDHVYVIPPSKYLVMLDGMIRLTEPERPRGTHTSIDLFFRTLADAYGKDSVAILLSGTGADGTLGLGRIKEEGGFVIAQDPAEAEYGDMPRSAIDSGLVDIVLPVEDMPAKLFSLREGARRLQIPLEPEQVQQNELEGGALHDLLMLLRLRTGNDFSQYKRPTLLRRIGRRLQVHEIADIPAYLTFVREHAEELNALFKDLLITVTNFFRDHESFDYLKQEIVPRLFIGKGPHDQVRVWSAGCATGEEAYSLAMLLAEHASHLADPPKIQIFATDIDERALAEARECRYPATIALDVSPERLRQFFIREGDQYRIKKELRELVLFAPHNVLRDPPFSRIDLISCRNLLIYLNCEMQERILAIFHFALSSDGFLFLGTSESAEITPALYATLDKKHRVYSRRAVTNRIPPSAELLPGRWHARPVVTIGSAEGNLHPAGQLHQDVVEQVAPPSILINAEYDIIHIGARASRYLRISGGEPSRNLLKLVHPQLRLDLRAALLESKSRPESDSAQARNIKLSLDGQTRWVSLSVRPVRQAPEQARGCFLVIFEDSGAAPKEAERSAREADVEVVQQLERELQHTKDQLRITVEQYETSTEELRASNEELQAINEELRSATEELETSKEELQSVNEELTTVNQEYREKIEEVGRANSDLQNLMASTDIGTIFLDRGLRIKRYTSRAEELFNITPADIGRPLEHFTNKLDYGGLTEDAEQVLRTLQTTEREVHSANDRWYLARLAPYRTIEDRIDGVVLTFVDITNRREIEQELRESDRNKDHFLAMLAHELRNPLGAMFSSLELLRNAETRNNAVGDRAREMIQRQLLHLLRLVDDLLDVERLTHGKIALDRRAVTLAEVVQSAIEACHPQIKDGTHQFNVTLPQEPVYLKADPMRLSQVLSNLLNNAFKYTHANGRIDLIAELQDTDVILRVRDTGVGIDKDMLPRLFDMYSQAAPLSGATKGLGVGLALVRRLVEMHGGIIEVFSEGPGKGSEFTVRLPGIVQPSPGQSINAAADGGEHVEPGQKLKILVIDDNRDGADALSFILESEGHEVHCAYDGPAGLEMGRELRPDVAIVDIGLPGMNGYEVAARLRPIVPDLRLIALSGWRLDSSRVQGRESVFDHYLRKPVETAELTRLLRKK
jgi:two-component system CheB/CheR fusion protein